MPSDAWSERCRVPWCRCPENIRTRATADGQGVHTAASDPRPGNGTLPLIVIGMTPEIGPSWAADAGVSLVWFAPAFGGAGVHDNGVTPCTCADAEAAGTKLSREGRSTPCIWDTSGLADEDVLRQERRHQHVRDVDKLADLEVDRDAAECIALLAGPPTLDEVVDHVEQCVAGSERRVLGAVLALLGHRYPGGRVEPARCCVLGWQVVVLPAESQVADALFGRLALVQREAHSQRRSHLDRRTTGLAVTLGKMRVPRREQPAGCVHGDEQSSSRAELFDVDVAGLFARRDRAQRHRR